MQTEPTTPAAGSSGSQAGRPRTPDGKAATSNSSSLGQCFGMGRTLEDNQQEEHPLGVVGLRNLGGALQCLLQLAGTAPGVVELSGSRCQTTLEKTVQSFPVDCGFVSLFEDCLMLGMGSVFVRAAVVLVGAPRRSAALICASSDVLQPSPTEHTAGKGAAFLFSMQCSLPRDAASGKALVLEGPEAEQHMQALVVLTAASSVLCAVGNTCFVNVALQCLRYTPKLPQAIYPDLLRFSLMEQEPVAMPVSLPSSIEAALSCDAACHSASELPSVPETTALADQSADISTPSAPVHSQANGPAPSNLNSPFHEQSVHNTGQANPVLSAAEAQQSVPSMSQQPEVPMLQLLQDRPEQPQLQSSQPVSIPGPHNGMVSHPQPPAQHQLQGSSPDLGAESEWTGLSGSNTSHQTASISDPPAGDASPSGPFELAAGQQQAQQQPQQLAGAAAESVPGDDSAQAPANQSTAAKQPPPVPVARVPLKKGEIAESFRALVKQVSWSSECPATQCPCLSCSLPVWYCLCFGVTGCFLWLQMPSLTLLFFALHS